jgi:DNA polymerase-3 subunit delta
MARTRKGSDDSLDPLRLRAELKRGHTAPLYLVAGDEPFLAGRAIRDLVDAGLGGVPKAYGFEELDAKDLKRGQLSDAARAVSMLAPKRVVLVRQAALLDRDPLRDEALALVESVPSGCMLILQAAKTDRRTRLGKALSQRAVTVMCRPLYDRQVDGFLHAEALEHGKRISLGAVTFLREMGGRRLGDLAGEVAKAVLAAGDSPTIELEHVEGASDTRLDTIFEFLDAVGERDLPSALLGLDRLLEAGVHPVAICSGLARHLRALLHARSLVDEGARPDDAARAAGSKVVFRMVPQIRANSAARLRAALVAVFELDSTLKGARIPPRLALERFVLRMARKRA